MTHEILNLSLCLAAAWAAGSLIGFERSYHGRAAGVRTHALVSLGAATVMMVAWAPALAPGLFPGDTPRLDPSRLAQGVMTGVGFIGAGVIFKEGVSVQGLTTAACLWATSAIGLLFGLGLFAPGALVTLAVLVTLIGLRWLESVLPTQVYALGVLRFHAGVAPDEARLREMLSDQGVGMDDVSHALLQEGEVFEFRGNLRTRHRGGLAKLAQHLRDLPGLREFEIQRISK